MPSSIVQEDAFIPFITEKLPKGPYLVLAPHPDDETFGMGGTIIKAGQAGIDVTTLFVTDGRLGGDIEIRKKEAEKAAKILSVRDTIFFDIPDRELFSHRQAFKLRLKELLLSSEFETVFSPSLQEYHPDHRAVTLILFDLLEEVGMIEKEVWLYEIIRQGDVNRLIDISEFVEQKRRAMEAYSSQLGQNVYKDVVLGINRARSITVHHLGCNFAEGFLSGSLLQVKNEYKRRYLLLKHPCLND